MEAREWGTKMAAVKEMKDARECESRGCVLVHAFLIRRLQ